MTLLAQYFAAKAPEERSNAAIAYLAAIDHITEENSEIAESIRQELEDQRAYLKLIASENYSSLAVQQTMGNLLTDKYAEGYAHHRFYAGCDNVDRVEDLAVNELKKLFNAQHAYVQPHSGADANLVAFWSVIVQRIQGREVAALGKKSVDELTADEYEKIRKVMLSQKILGMSLNSGGHLTHGFRHNVSSKMFQAISYDVDPETEKLDYDVIAALARQHKPLILLAGYSAYSRRLNFATLRQIADDVDATLMVDMAHFAGLVAGKVFTGEYDPVAYAHIVTGTTHKTLRGPRGGFVLCQEAFKDTVNKGCPLILCGPLPHVIAAKAVAFREANTPAFERYAQAVVDNAKSLSEALIRRGARIVSGGTDNHLMVVDLTDFGITGRHAETALRQAHLTVNRNAIPFDKNGAWYTSGIRIGTPAMTTLGMGATEMEEIADIIVEVLSQTVASLDSKGQKSRAVPVVPELIFQQAQQRVKSLLQGYRLYPELP